MKNARINYLIVGSFVLAMLAGLIVSVALLSGPSGTTDKYFTVYRNVTGIGFGTQVLYEGYPIGQVEDITPVGEGGRMRFRIDFSVIEGWRIPSDSVAVVAAPGLLSAFTVSIQAGQSDISLTPGDEVTGRAATNIMTVMSDLAGQIGVLTETSIRPLLDNLNRTVTRLDQLIEQDGQKMVRDFGALAQVLAEKTPVITEQLTSFTDKMNETADQVQAIVSPANRSKVASVLTNLDTAVARYADLSTDLGQTRESIDHLIQSIDHMVTDSKPDIEMSVSDFRFTLETVARHIESINLNLEASSRNLYEFSRQIRQNPGLLLGGKPPVDEAAAQ